MKERGKIGRIVEVQTYSPVEAIEEIYARLTSNLDAEWTPFDNVKCIIALGNQEDGHHASLDLKGLAKVERLSTEIIAWGKINDPHLVSNRGDTLVFAKTKTREKPTTTTERSDYLKGIIEHVASDYKSPDYYDGSLISLGRLVLGKGYFGKDHEIRGVFVSVDRHLHTRGRVFSEKVGRSIIITPALIEDIASAIENTRVSTRV